jgi:protein-tyrosine-phosphatase
MRFAPHAQRPTENTLSHHLAGLAACGLIRATRRGRTLLYCVDLDATEALIGYLALDVGRARPDLLAPLLATRDTAMTETGFNVLFICSGNSARSIFAEALLRDLGKGRFRAFSAGYSPNSALNPFALEILKRNGHDVQDMRSKHVSEFKADGAPVMDFVFTVCDTAAGEECPTWPGQPITGHWGLPDPVKATGTEAEKALVFAQTYAALRRRITSFVELPFESLNRIALQARVDVIGSTADAPEKA